MTSSFESLSEIWPSIEMVVPSFTLIPNTSIVLLALMTIDRKLSECGHIGVMVIASILGETIGPPAERL